MGCSTGRQPPVGEGEAEQVVIAYVECGTNYFVERECLYILERMAGRYLVDSAVSGGVVVVEAA